MGNEPERVCASLPLLWDQRGIRRIGLTLVKSPGITHHYLDLYGWPRESIRQNPVPAHEPLSWREVEACILDSAHIAGTGRRLDEHPENHTGSTEQPLHGCEGRVLMYQQ
ncbi:hypothetical protein NQZ68_011480 [Dissostichus eleginoides]|nr:hypothetical protein NQZ68_011480 [Dissostichus eleginoides]